MEKKLRYSRQREMIYEYLCGTEEHPSAETVYEALRPQIPGLSLGTVYRNLKLLEELGKIQRISAQGIERYDACRGDHAHFLCQRCGKLVDLGCAEAEAIRQAVKLPQGATLTRLDITLTGVCCDCQK